MRITPKIVYINPNEMHGIGSIDNSTSQLRVAFFNSENKIMSITEFSPEDLQTWLEDYKNNKASETSKAIWTYMKNNFGYDGKEIKALFESAPKLPERKVEKKQQPKEKLGYDVNLNYNSYDVVHQKKKQQEEKVVLPKVPEMSVVKKKEEPSGGLSSVIAAVYNLIKSYLPAFPGLSMQELVNKLFAGVGEKSKKELIFQKLEKYNDKNQVVDQPIRELDNKGLFESEEELEKFVNVVLYFIENRTLHEKPLDVVKTFSVNSTLLIKLSNEGLLQHFLESFLIYLESKYKGTQAMLTPFNFSFQIHFLEKMIKNMNDPENKTAVKNAMKSYIRMVNEWEDKPSKEVFSETFKKFLPLD